MAKKAVMAPGTACSASYMYSCQQQQCLIMLWQACHAAQASKTWLVAQLRCLAILAIHLGRETGSTLLVAQPHCSDSTEITLQLVRLGQEISFCVGRARESRIGLWKRIWSGCEIPHWCTLASPYLENLLGCLENICLVSICQENIFQMSVIWSVFHCCIFPCPCSTHTSCK